MIRQSSRIGKTTLQTLFVSGGNYVTTPVPGLAVPVGLSILYTPSRIGPDLDLEVSCMIDGVTKNGANIFGRGEIWKNGTPWKYFGAPVVFTDAIDLSGQISGTFKDTISSLATTITYSLYISAWKQFGAGVTSSSIGANWGMAGPSVNGIGGGSTASFINIIERI